ncbi:MAG: hypothetical protein JSR76_04205 [Verrucomicrobia bacterium]|nr:hypothetical protein [Verrucomicrobiota bacterium]
MLLRKANLIIIFFSIFFPLSLAYIFYSYSFFTTDAEKNLQEIFQARTQIQQEVFHVGKDVHKSFWLMNHEPPLEIHLESPLSELRLEKEGASYEMVEMLKNVNFYFYYNQDLYTIEAQECQISYRSSLIKAHNLHLKSYEIPSDMKAQELNTLAKEGSLPLKEAYNLSCHTLALDKEKKELIAERGDEPIVFTHPNFSIASASMVISPNKLSFKEEVRLKNETFFGVADQIDFFPKDHHIELVSNGEEGALFWDQKENIKIRAKTVVLEKDPLTGETIARGLGKVHFSLKETEFFNIFNMIETCTNSLF